MSQTQSGEMR